MVKTPDEEDQLAHLPETMSASEANFLARQDHILHGAPVLTYRYAKVQGGARATPKLHQGRPWQGRAVGTRGEVGIVTGPFKWIVDSGGPRPCMHAGVSEAGVRAVY